MVNFSWMNFSWDIKGEITAGKINMVISWVSNTTISIDNLLLQLEYKCVMYILTCWPITNYGHNNVRTSMGQFKIFIAIAYHKGRYFADKITAP
jgi:hypothetical protein